MTAASYVAGADDELPDFLQDVHIAKKLAEIGKVQGKNGVGSDASKQEKKPPWQRGEMLHKEIIASGKTWKEFGPKDASAAWYAGFAKAIEKVFVSDGSAAIEEMQAVWFSDYTSVLDIMHALSYSLSAARAIHADQGAAWECYKEFASFIWRGEVDRVIRALEVHQRELGTPPDDPKESDPREIIRRARVYYQNHRSRMNYSEYRRKRYPLTSSIMESSVKQVSRRVKVTEKFWSGEGGEAILQLRADYLSTSDPMAPYWTQAIRDANGLHAYNLSV